MNIITPWTVESVKEQLPSVTVQTGRGRKTVIQEGYVLGRKERFATVRLEDGSSYEYAWETIVNALNNGKVLKV